MIVILIANEPIRTKWFTISEATAKFAGTRKNKLDEQKTMETKEVPKHVRLATKLIILQQCQLELLDELKDTSLYRLDIKNLTNNLTTKLEKHLEKYLNTLDDEEKDLSFTSMQRASHKLLEISLEELHLMDELNANEK